MPSRLRRSALFRQGGDGPAQRASRIMQHKFYVAAMPWGGYTPDLAPDQMGPGDARELQGFVSHKGEMRQDFGWEQLNSAELPLGTTTPPAAGGSEEPVVGLFNYVDNNNIIVQLAVTNEGTLGHLYEDTGDTWAHRAYTGTGAGMTGTSRDLMDSAYFPADDILIFCNGVDAVYQFANGTTYTEFNEGDDWTGAAGGDIDTFGARSVEAATDRVVFLNTIEGLTAHLNRVRWTTTGASAVLTPSSTGAGFLDLNELSIGYRILRLGPILACYFDDGVAFLRRTGRATEAFQREYVSQTRGLMGPQTVVDIGGGRHFGLFTDGFYTLNTTGVWEQFGLRNIDGKEFTTFTKTFLSNLNHEFRDKAVMHYDQRNNLVRLAAPMGSNTENSEVWVFDLDGGTAWPDDTYSPVPLCWGSLDIDTVKTWSSTTSTWAATTAAWRTFGTQIAEPAPTHGTLLGMVFRHDEALTQRDGANFSYSFTSALSPHTDPTQVKVLDKVHVGYIRLVDADGNDPGTITVSIQTEDETVTSTLAQTRGDAGEQQIDFVSWRASGNYVGCRINGTGPVRVVQIVQELHFQGDQETHVGTD